MFKQIAAVSVIVEQIVEALKRVKIGNFDLRPYAFWMAMVLQVAISFALKLNILAEFGFVLPEEQLPVAYIATGALLSLGSNVIHWLRDNVSPK